MMRSILGAVALYAGALLVVGCQKVPPAIVPVSGVVTVNGQPLPNALVTFTPMLEDFGAEYIATGITDEKGRFTVSCAIKEGAAVAETRVTIAEAPAPEGTRGMSEAAQNALTKHMNSQKNRPIPQNYKTLNGTPFVFPVTPDRTEYNLELKR
jgi:hypothetical protein